jgi:hypothetical protein
MERKKEAEQKGKEAKTDEPRKSSFMDKLKGWFKKKENENKSATENKAQETVAKGNEDKNASKPGIPIGRILELQGRVDPTPRPVEPTEIDPLLRIVDRDRSPR